MGGHYRDADLLEARKRARGDFRGSLKKACAPWIIRDQAASAEGGEGVGGDLRTSY